MGKSKMTKEDAKRIQRAADKSGKNQGFKSRAMSAAARNEIGKATEDNET